LPVGQQDMNTRRNRLLTRDQIRDNTRPQRDKVVTLRDLSQTRVIVPNEIHDTGMSLIVTVANDGRLQPGLIESDKLPVTRPISDLNRLNRARNVVSSLEVTQTRSSAIEEVKEVLVGALASSNKDIASVQVKAGIQAELIRCRVLSEALTENKTSMAKNQQNELSIYVAIANRWFEACQTAINVYLLDVQCGPKSQKLVELISEYLVPRWFFDRFTRKVPEMATTSIDNLFFPKKISKMITFTVGEVESEKFFQNAASFGQNLIYLRRVCALHVTKDKAAILYPIPGNLAMRIHDFSDLPSLDRVLTESTMLTITVLHMAFAAIQIKALNVDTLTDHLRSFIVKENEGQNTVDVEIPTTIPKDQLKSYPFMNQFTDEFIKEEKGKASLILKIHTKTDLFEYEADSSVPIKAQYREKLNGSIVNFQGLHFPATYGKVFHLTDKEYNSISTILLDQPVKLVAAHYPVSIFTIKVDSTFDQDRVKLARTRLDVIRPLDIKEANYGPASTPLTKKSRAFLTGLEKSKFPPTFIKNIASYLQSFNLAPFQEQAVKIMTASLQTKEVIIDQEPEDPESESEEVPTFGNF